jgi:hypothetical protein
VTLRDALSAELAAARRRRDSAVTTALRTTLAALDNAEAIPHPSAAPQDAPRDDPSPTVTSPHFPGALAGLGSGDAARRELTESEMHAIVAHERDDLLSHADRLTRLCRRDEADGARRAAATLTGLLVAPGAPPRP